MRGARSKGGRRRQAHLDAVVLHELHTGAPVFSSAPIAPEEQIRTNGKRMERDTDLARLCGRAAIPLALLTERTETATLDAGSVHHTQAAIGFSALLMRSQFLVCRAPKRSIRLERTVPAREATSLPCGADLWRRRARGTGRVQ